jgi:hypothetical protein
VGRLAVAFCWRGGRPRAEDGKIGIEHRPELLARPELGKVGDRCGSV